MWSEDVYELDSLTVAAGATLTVAGGSSVRVSGSLAVNGGAAIVLQGRNTDGPVDGEWQGVGATIEAADLRVERGAAISADGQGYVAGAGPGAGGADSGGHGGAGGGYGAPAVWRETASTSAAPPTATRSRPSTSAAVAARRAPPAAASPCATPPGRASPASPPSSIDGAPGGGHVGAVALGGCPTAG